MINQLRRIALIIMFIPILASASSNWDQMSWDWDNWHEPLFTQGELDDAVQNAVSAAEEAKDIVITQRESDLTGLQAIIDKLNETVGGIPGALDSYWDVMDWDDDDWFNEFRTVISQSELRQVIIDASDPANVNQYLLVKRDDVIADETEAIDNAIVDKDGDGLTDAQEVARGSNPNSYDINLIAGWNLISVSRIPDDNSPENMLGGNTADTVWIWDGNRFKVATELLPSRGHWVYATTDDDVPVILPESQ